MQKLLQISAGVFLWIAGGRHRAPGLRIKTENKGFARSQAQTAPALQREKRKIPASGLRIKTENKGFAGSRAQTAPALQREKRKSRGFGFAHQNGEQRVCGESSANPAGRKCSVEIINKKSRRLSLVNGGRRRRHIRIIQFYGAPETCGRGECVFLWGVKR